MKQILLSSLSLSLLINGLYAMQQENAADAFFVSKVKECGLTDDSEIKKFFDVATGWGIDPTSTDVAYMHPQNAGTTISIFQTIGQGYREIIRLPDGTFDISKVDSAFLGNEKGSYRAKNQTYQNAMDYLKMLKSAQDYKAKQAAQPEEKPLTLADLQQRALRLAFMAPEQRMAEALNNIPVVDFSTLARPAAVSRPAHPTESRIAVEDKGFIHQAFGPEAVLNNQNARDLLERNDVKAYVDNLIARRQITLPWEDVQRIAVLEENVPFKGAWKIHLGPKQSIMWCGGLNFESR
jgi:hypothetical protein